MYLAHQPKRPFTSYAYSLPPSGSSRQVPNFRSFCCRFRASIEQHEAWTSISASVLPGQCITGAWQPPPGARVTLEEVGGLRFSEGSETPTPYASRILLWTPVGSTLVS